MGAGAVGPGEVFDSCGTAEALVRAVSPPVAPDRIAAAVAGHVTVGWHVVGEFQALLGAQRAGFALQRFLDLLGVGPDRLAALEAAALAVPAGTALPTVLDADGEQATLAGIGRHPSPAHVWRAAVEAVGARSGELLATVRAVAGDVDRLVVAGGWSRSPTLRSVKARRLGRAVYPPVTEAGARGAALLAGIAAGLWEGVEDLPPFADRRGPAAPGEE